VTVWAFYSDVALVSLDQLQRFFASSILLSEELNAIMDLSLVVIGNLTISTVNSGLGTGLQMLREEVI